MLSLLPLPSLILHVTFIPIAVFFRPPRVVCFFLLIMLFFSTAASRPTYFFSSTTRKRPAAFYYYFPRHSPLHPSPSVSSSPPRLAQLLSCTLLRTFPCSISRRAARRLQNRICAPLSAYQSSTLTVRGRSHTGPDSGGSGSGLLYL